MAEVRANLSLGGYDDKFVKSVDDDVICPICMLPVKDPILTRCGHRFCRVCLDGHLNSRGFPRLTCPVDRGILTPQDVFPDIATQRRIGSLLVYCPSEGCKWTGELRYKAVHLEGCPFRVVSCTNTNCDDTMTRNNLQAHVTTTCPWRILRCNHCGVSHPACETEAHDRKCRRKPLNCPKSCGAVIPREELATHRDNDCPLTITPCTYAEMGCTTQVQRREIENHLQVAVQPHLDLACAKLNNTQEELKISKDTTRNLAVRVRELENQLDAFQTTLNSLSLRIDDDAGKKVNALENKMDTFQTQFGNVEGKVKKILKDVVESKTKHMEEFPPYLWTVTDFWKKVSRAKNGREIEIESNSFYLGLHGYKMKLVMFPNGTNGGVNHYISLFFVLMKGQYDAILPWPFRYEFKFTVIDQNPDLKQRQNYSTSFSSGSNPIQRPKGRLFIAGPTFILRPKSEENKAWGSNVFLSHEELRKKSYVVDETLFIKFEVSRGKNV